MIAAAASVPNIPARSPAPPVLAPPLTPFPSATALGLERSTHAELELVMRRGVMPDLASLVGWEFRGINHPGWARVVGIKKFMKGFYKAEDGDVMGYNCPIDQNVLDGRWVAKPDDLAPKRFGFYKVEAVDATRRDNKYLHAVLLDYGAGGNAKLDPTQGLRDYVVQVDAANPDLFLGKAYYALGPLRLNTNFFILERHRRGLTDFARR
jgi:hypothetical protein